MGANSLLEMKKITKVYPNGVIANQDIDFSVNESEIHALLGENGAGKSTLMKILFGVERPDQGEIILNGEKVTIDNSLEAIKMGIGMVHQHFMLVEDLTVMENIMLGMEPTKGIFIDEQTAKEKVQKMSDQYNFNLNPNDKISQLNVSQKQKVEILKVLIRGAKIIILDEPTAVLTPQETQELFIQLEELKNTGHTLIFISHKLKEITQICDRMTIMRSGKDIGTYDVAGITTDEISSLMIGRDIVKEVTKSKATPGKTILDVKDLQVFNDEGMEVVKELSLKVRAGEVVGIAAVEGNGQRELLDAITGLGVYAKGEIKVDGNYQQKKNAPLDRREQGLVHIPEDRFTYGVMGNESVADNLISNRYNNKDYNKGFFMDSDKIKKLIDQLIVEYEIKTDSPATPVQMLSGGNAQKVVVAREMSYPMKLLVADQPTRGIDVGTADFIHRRIIELRDENHAVLLSSADINEVLELSDSLIVMYDGKISGYFEDTEGVTEEELGLYMLGLEAMDDEVIRSKLYAE